MIKIDATVKKETRYISLWVLILSVLLQAVFLVIGKWDYTVLLGNVLSGTAVILNFLLMGITVQKALEKGERLANAESNEKDDKTVKNTMKASQSYRFLFLIVVVIIGVVLPCFSIWTVIIPVFFPRIAIAFRPLFGMDR